MRFMNTHPHSSFHFDYARPLTRGIGVLLKLDWTWRTEQSAQQEVSRDS